MIYKNLETPREFADHITNEKYKQADRLKVNKKDYHNVLAASYRAGQISFIEGILNANRKEPYTDMDTFMGDIHLALVAIHNDMRKLIPGKIAPLTLEEILKDQDLV